ncbi:MAG: FAD-binding oxidoreductase, partial [Acidimicrobiia bacterium]
MTSISAAMAELVPAMSEPVPGAPEAELVLAPTTLEEMARVLDVASEHHLAVLVWGGGTHQGLGNRVEPDVVVSTFRLGRVVDYQPEDLTLVVEAGVPVALVEEMLAERRQTAVLPELPGAATVGGVVAAGVSGFRRSRYGPTRDRMLEATMVTGDGRIVRGGGRVVKNVTGYDLPRLITGSFGALGVVGQVCLKLWPLPEASLTVEVDDPEQAGEVLYRPLALLERDGKACAYLAGTRAEVEAQADRVGGRALPGLVWPEEPVGTVRWSLRVPPALTREAVGRVPSGWT